MDVVFELGLSRIVGLIRARVEVTREEECKVSWEHEYLQFLTGALEPS